jgi:DNA-binding MarR family transcriptional regulator
MADRGPLAVIGFFRAAMEVTVRRSRGDLTARQLTVLLTVYSRSGPHTVRGLAAELGVAKPVITRALAALDRSGLIRRRRDETDRRNVRVQRTVQGSVFLNDLAEAIRAAWVAALPSAQSPINSPPVNSRAGGPPG